MNDTTDLCPCASQTLFPDCCGPYIEGAKIPETAEQMMRARYTAHARVDIDFIVNTHYPDTAGNVSKEGTRRWAEGSDWLGLDILSTKKGGTQDKTGEVEFIAHYRDRNGERHRHHELSLFNKVNGQWRFRDSQVPEVGQVRREAPKVGRNDPCPCGSGKKYKKYCG